MIRFTHRRGFSALLSTGWAAAILFVAAPASAQHMGPDAGAKGDDNQGSIELVDPKTLRVCADPNNLPFSNDKGEGFENKIAEFLAKKLGKDLAYTYYPGATGFVRNTLNAHLCDVILGMPQGNDLVQTTNPYYRTTYAIVTRAGSELDGAKDARRSASEGKAASHRPCRQHAARQCAGDEWSDGVGEALCADGRHARRILRRGDDA